MKWPSIAHLLLTAILMLGGCDQNSTDDTHQNSTITLQVWAHAGQQAERDVLQSQVARFNQQADDIDVKLTFIPERDYNSQVQAAALAHDLPDILEFDGPYLYNYIWQGHLLPLEELLPSSVIHDLLPSIVAQEAMASTFILSPCLIPAWDCMRVKAPSKQSMHGCRPVLPMPGTLPSSMMCCQSLHSWTRTKRSWI